MDYHQLVTAFGALAGVLLIAVLAVRSLRRILPGTMLGQVGQQARLQLRATLAIDPRRRLLLASCDGREILLLITPEGCVTCGWLGSEAPNATVLEKGGRHAS